VRLTWIIKLAIIWYIALCAVHYFNQRPMWNDEQAVFYSVESFSTSEIFSRSLLSIQVFPRAYFWMIQKFSQQFDYHLLSLRFFSFICMMAAFCLWLKLARLELKNNLQYLTFVLSWCGSVLLVYYSAELKQYSMDVLGCAIFLLFLYYQKDLQQKHKYYPLILVSLPALMLVSYTSLFFLLFPLYNLILDYRTDKKCLRCIALYGASLVIFLSISYYFDVRLRPTAVLNREWNSYFISLSSTGDFFQTLGDGINNLFSRWFAERPRIIKKIARVFVGFGLLNMFRAFFVNIKKDKYYLKSIQTIALVLFAEFLVLGALRKYPFTVPRTSLFFSPVVLILTIQGISWVKNIFKPAYVVLHGLYIVFLLAVSIGIAQHVFGGDLGAMPLLWRP